MKNHLIIKRFALYMILTVVLAANTGCGSRMDPSVKGNGTPVYGGKVIMAVPQDPDFLDPHLAAASGTYEMMFNVFEGLMKPDEKGKLYPAVAREYRISDNGRKYTFILRDGVKFHNGNTVTPSDVKYSIERLAGLNGHKALSSSFKVVSNVETPDDKTVVVSLKSPDTSFLSNCTEAILPKDNPDHNKRPIGTGPFKFVEYIPAQRVVIEKFKDYWKKDLPYLDSVEFRIMPDSESALLSFKAGEIDMYPRIDNERLGELGLAFRSVQGMQNMLQILAFNLKRKPFNDIRMRKAINYAVNADLIIKGVAAGYGTKLGSAMSPAMSDYFQPGLEKIYSTDINKAKQLFREAGIAEGYRTRITVPSNYKFHVDTAQVIADQLNSIGIKAEIEQVEWGVWLDRVYKRRDYDMTVIGLAGKLDPYKVLNRFMKSNPANFFNYSNAKYDNLMNISIKEFDDIKRATLYKEAQKLLTEDAAAVFIMDPNFTVAMRAELGGYKLYPVYIQDMSSIYYTE